MANEKRLIDANALFDELLKRQYSEQTMGIVHSYYPQMRAIVAEQPTVDAYTAEQVASIIQQADKAEARNQELEKECAWLKSCLNCKIRKECPRHCGKLVHGCDHWEYGDSVVHGRWIPKSYDYGMGEFTLFHCSECDTPNAFERNYCPNCGADMRGETE